MSEEELKVSAEKLTLWQEHRFMVLVGVTIVISLFLVGVALSLYNSSGAAQLDLSRPGYKSVSEKAQRSDDFSSYPAIGVIDKAALEQFKKLYSAQAQRATNVDSFGGDVMSDQALSLDDQPAPDAAAQ
jgi:hypothetical protein